MVIITRQWQAAGATESSSSEITQQMQPLHMHRAMLTAAHQPTSAITCLNNTH